MADISERRRDEHQFLNTPPEPAHIVRVGKVTTTNLGPYVQVETRSPNGNEYTDTFTKYPGGWRHEGRRGAYDVRQATAAAPLSDAMSAHLDRLHGKHAPAARKR